MPTFPLKLEEYQKIFADEASAFRDAYVRADPSERVPNCPDWTVAELGAHISSIYHRVAELLRRGSMEALDPADFAAPSDPDAILAYFVEGASALSSQFATVDTHQQIWTYAGIQPALFWPRRMTHETMVHAFDLDELHPPLHVPPIVAVADGVDEFLTAQLQRKLIRQPVASLRGTLGLNATDSNDRWVVSLTPNSIDILDASTPADAELSGTAHRLLNFLWRRSSANQLSPSGDLDIIATYECEVRL